MIKIDEFVEKMSDVELKEADERSPEILYKSITEIENELVDIEIRKQKLIDTLEKLRKEFKLVAHLPTPEEK